MLQGCFDRDGEWREQDEGKKEGRKAFQPPYGLICKLIWYRTVLTQLWRKAGRKKGRKKGRKEGEVVGLICDECLSVYVVCVSNRKGKEEVSGDKIEFVRYCVIVFLRERELWLIRKLCILLNIQDHEIICAFVWGTKAVFVACFCSVYAVILG